ncbi:MerR family transcriptional regulator [Phytoactinopolyspora halotolerans]|uniref:MerR family transcriptional regulator n=1 Tax=Phytoactinopolyspora halotolerans TaxID=1981512 RepID=A0A6L9S2P3_9ACTN|nr:MerR family transcriptional regulator [Phytoactinopolyspora halotolerans]NED99080.1 MerR family transcriptional regulator [Phytoactinopolyspora halotolerans]
MTTTEIDRSAPEAPAARSISEVAELTGVSAHTLRYYERIGLLDVNRDHAGRRLFSPNDIQRVVFITRLRHTDMPIRQVQRYFALVEAGPETQPERLELLVRHRESVLAQLTDLHAALETIDYKIAIYGGSDTSFA